MHLFMWTVEALTNPERFTWTFASFMVDLKVCAAVYLQDGSYSHVV